MKLAGFWVIASALVAAAIGMGARTPGVEAQAGGRFAIDANLDNGICAPVDDTVSVGSNGTLRVAVCALGVTEAPEALTIHVGYDTSFLTAPEMPDTGGALDDNPDANAGLTTFGSETLGQEWDCTTFGLYKPTADDPRTPGGDAKINCNANLSNSIRTLHNGAMVVITLQTGSNAGTTQISLLPDTVAAYPQGTLEVEYGCHDPNGTIPCDGATITIGVNAATPTPVAPTPAPTEAAAATATRVTFDATQAALPNGVHTGEAPLAQTQTALENITPANPQTATAVSSALGSVAATGTAVDRAIAASASSSVPGDTNRSSIQNKNQNDGGGGTNKGAIIGIVTVIIAVIAGASGGYWWYRRRGASPQ